MKFLICHTLRENDKSERKKKNAKGKDRQKGKI